MFGWWETSREFVILVCLLWNLPGSTNKLRCNDDVLILVIKISCLLSLADTIFTVILAMLEYFDYALSQHTTSTLQDDKATLQAKDNGKLWTLDKHIVLMYVVYMSLDACVLSHSTIGFIVVMVNVLINAFTYVVVVVIIVIVVYPSILVVDGVGVDVVLCKQWKVVKVEPSVSLGCQPNVDDVVGARDEAD